MTHIFITGPRPNVDCRARKKNMCSIAPNKGYSAGLNMRAVGNISKLETG
jgi:hypothetical protein